jgi:steroid delta-isomerase-like uncharacterized protein
MAADENKAILRRVYQAFSSGDLAALDGLFAADFVDHTALPGQAPGLAGTKQTIALFRAAFPDMQLAVEDLVAEGDRVAARVSMRGTHRGALLGIAPTGKRVAMAGMDLVRFAGGRIVERRGQEDMLGLMQQLGAIPAPGQATG